MISVILWDVDGTLLDFEAAEKAAVQMLFREFGLGECTDAMVARYSEINKGYWERLERGELTREQVLVGRYEEFFREIGVDETVAVPFNEQYQVRLGDTVVLCDNCYELIASLRGRVRQYVVSNGTVVAQERKLKNSGLGELFDGIFLSEKMGAEKPTMEFFNVVFNAVGPVKKEEVLIVGDSLTSDIRGGNNAGIRTAWYNPKGKRNEAGVKVDYELKNLNEVLGLL